MGSGGDEQVVALCAHSAGLRETQPGPLVRKQGTAPARQLSVSAGLLQRNRRKGPQLFVTAFSRRPALCPLTMRQSLSYGEVIVLHSSPGFSSPRRWPEM